MKNDTPLISVLMTSFNREKYIADAIESVLNSTYQNLELIIVDDCSKDRTVEIAKSYESKDHRIKVYVNETNLGDYPNRNKAASYAKGKYLKYVDADDMIYPYGLEQLVFYMEQFQEAGYGLCSLDQDKSSIYPFQLSPGQAYRRHYFGQTIFYKAPLSSIINKVAFEIIGGFSGKQHLGDFELWHLLSQKFSVVLMPHGMVWYREHAEQQMNDNRTDPFVPFKYLLYQKEVMLNNECPLEPDEKEIVINRINGRIAKSVLSAYRKYGFKKGKQLQHSAAMNNLSILFNGLFSSW